MERPPRPRLLFDSIIDQEQYGRVEAECEMRAPNLDILVPSESRVEQRPTPGHNTIVAGEYRGGRHAESPRWPVAASERTTKRGDAVNQMGRRLCQPVRIDAAKAPPDQSHGLAVASMEFLEASRQCSCRGLARTFVASKAPTLGLVATNRQRRADDLGGVIGGGIARDHKHACRHLSTLGELAFPW